MRQKESDFSLTHPSEKKVGLALSLAIFQNLELNVDGAAVLVDRKHFIYGGPHGRQKGAIHVFHNQATLGSQTFFFSRRTIVFYKVFSSHLAHLKSINFVGRH
jgi:hypothetical protein